MLPILFLLLWQLLTLALAIGIWIQQRNSALLLLIALLILQILANIFQLDILLSNPLFYRLRYAISAFSVAGYGILFGQHLSTYLFRNMAIGVGVLFSAAGIVLMFISSVLLDNYIRWVLVAESVSMVMLSMRYGYEIAKDPPLPQPHSSFPPFVWMAAGLFCYFLSMTLLHACFDWLQQITEPISGIRVWGLVNQVQLVALYIFFTVALLISLPNPKRCL